MSTAFTQPSPVIQTVFVESSISLHSLLNQTDANQHSCQTYIQKTGVTTYSYEFGNFARRQTSNTNKILHHVLGSICLRILLACRVTSSNIVKARNATLHM